jgi:hypothetical protein
VRAALAVTDSEGCTDIAGRSTAHIPSVNDASFDQAGQALTEMDVPAGPVVPMATVGPMA